MTLYQKIPTTSSRIDPMMLVAAAGIVLLSVVATAVIVHWLPDGERAGESSAVPATAAARASSAASAGLPAPATTRKVREQNSQARATQFASA